MGGSLNTVILRAPVGANNNYTLHYVYWHDYDNIKATILHYNSMDKIKKININ